MVFSLKTLVDGIPVEMKMEMETEVQRMNEYLRIDGEKWFEMARSIIELTEQEDDGIDAVKFLEAMTEGPLGIDLWLMVNEFPNNGKTKDKEHDWMISFQLNRIRLEAFLRKQKLLGEDESIYCGKVGVKQGNLVFRSLKTDKEMEKACKEARDKGLLEKLNPDKKVDEKVDEKDDEKDIDKKVEEAIGVEEKKKMEEWLDNVPNVECAKTMSDAIDDARKWRMLVAWVKKTGEDEDSNIWDFLGDELGLEASGTETK